MINFKSRGIGLCKECGVEFEKLGNRLVFCSRKCCDINHKKQVYNTPHLLKQKREAIRDNHYQRRYGISYNDKEQLLKDQNFSCYICGESNLTTKTAKLDHCHKTNKIRKILCNNCNLGLGSFKDNTKLLEKAINYLEEHNEKKE